MNQQVPDARQQELLQIARDAIGHRLGFAVVEQPAGNNRFLQREDFGTFVTLTLEDNLRGCIGYIEPVAPLGEQIRMCALAAAFQDPRFTPLARHEFDRISIEISLLFPPVSVRDTDEIQVGRDGLIVSRGGFHGLLLAQVAVDHGWDRETFLNETCWKAGLPEDAWRDGSTSIQRFESIVFGETA